MKRKADDVGVAKAMTAFLSGEMRDTVELVSSVISTPLVMAVS